MYFSYSIADTERISNYSIIPSMSSVENALTNESNVVVSCWFFPFLSSLFLNCKDYKFLFLLNNSFMDYFNSSKYS